MTNRSQDRSDDLALILTLTMNLRIADGSEMRQNSVIYEAQPPRFAGWGGGGCEPHSSQFFPSFGVGAPLWQMLDPPLLITPRSQ